MKGKAFIGGIAGVACLASAAFAQEPYDSKLQASTFNTKLVQAMDACDTPTTTIGGLDACAPSNTTTDGTQFSVGKLLVKSKGGPSQVIAILKSSGNGDDTPPPANDLAGKTVRVNLTLRITRRSGPGGPAATFSDIDVVCAQAAAPIGTNGNFVFKGPLSGCLNFPALLASDQNLREIVSASIVDAGTGDAIAVPGVRKK